MPTSTKVVEPVDLPLNVPADRVYSFDMYNPAGIDDVGYLRAWKSLHDQDLPGMIWTPLQGGHWIATRGNLIRDIFRNPEYFSSRVLFLPKAGGEKYHMVPSTMDPPEHRPYREVVDKGLNLRAIRQMEGAIRAQVIELIDAFADKGGCDFVREFSSEFPIRVFMRMADLPMKDADLLCEISSGMTRPSGNTPEEMADVLQKATEDMFAYVNPYIDARMGKDGTDLISLTVNSTVNGEPISRDKLLKMISLLLLAGLDSTTNFLNIVMDHLGRNPDLVEQLASNPETIKRCVEEMVRRFPLVASARIVAKNIEFGGVHLNEGDMVLLPTALHGLDDQENPDAWKLDFNRKQISHSTFGDGPHRCAGLHLARLEVTVMLEEWLRRIPRFQVVEGCEPTFQAGIVASVGNVRLKW